MFKTFTIISKNVKVVSRNWMYVALLAILPLIFIFATSLLLDSVDSENVEIGIVSDSNSPPIKEIIPEANFIEYGSFEFCKEDLKSGAVPVCIDTPKGSDIANMEIYFDNSKLFLSKYAKQYVSEKILEKQLTMFELTLDEVLFKMNHLEENVDLAKEELEMVLSELIVQEKRIIEHQENLSEIKEEFDESHSDVKENQELMRENIKTFGEASENLEGNITEFRERNEKLRMQIESIKPVLEETLPPDEYEEVEEELNSTLKTLDLIDKNLEVLESTGYYDDPDSMLEDFDNAVETLDKMAILFEELDDELEKGIEIMQKNQERSKEMLEEIEKGKEDLDEIKGEIESASEGGAVLHDAFEIDESASYLFFPLIFILIIAFTSIILSNIIIAEQTHKKSYIKEMATPTGDSIFLFCDFFVALSIVVIQIAVLLLLGEYLFNLNILSNLLYIFPVSILVASVFVFTGMSIGYVVKSKNISILISTFALLFLIVFSDLIVPRQLSGNILRIITGINPFVIAEKLLFNKMVFSETIKSAGLYMALLGFFLFTLIIFSYFCKKVGKYKIMKS